MRDMVLDKKTNKYYDIYLSQQEKRDRKKRVFGIMKRQQEEFELEQARLKHNGICPHCHCYRPDSGICDCEL